MELLKKAVMKRDGCSDKDEREALSKGNLEKLIQFWKKRGGGATTKSS